MPQQYYPHFPLNFYKNHFKKPYHYPPIHSANTSSTHLPSLDNTLNIKDEKNKSNKNNNDFLFDLFGLKIYYDDILLISLLYFLYSEGVKDDGLFIVLILLLLS